MTKDNLTKNASNEAESPAFLVGAVIGSALFELDVNHAFWAEALSTIHKTKLIEMCEHFKIPTKGKDRYRLASNLSKKIDLNKRMKIVVGFE